MNHGIFANHRLPNIPLNNTQALAQYKVLDTRVPA
jgi:hypothetical protein